MTPIELSNERPGALLIGGAPAGQDARLLAGLAGRATADILHVALDDAHAARLADTAAFFAPGLDILVFPAWDCLPYDRASPNPEIVSRRVDVLTRLADSATAGGVGRARLVVTTVNAVLQRVPPRAAFSGSAFSAAIGARVDTDALQAFLTRNGYVRAQTVREPGEFAVRGGIVDLFPTGTDEPLRLDLFGDELEGVRTFDPLNQRTTGRRDGIVLRPMSELFLDPDSIARFRSGYRELFGAVADEDPLYEAVSAGRRYIGMEHWLPLFHTRMETLFDYLPDAVLTLDHQADEARTSRLAQIADFYDARRTMQGVEKRASAPAYKPLPPDRLYLDEGAWDRALLGRAVGRLSPFAPPDRPGAVDGGGRRGRDFADARSSPEVNLFEAVREHIAALREGGRRVVVAATSRGARERLRNLLGDGTAPPIDPVDRWDEAAATDSRRTVAAVMPLDTGFVAPDLAVITEQDVLGDRLARPARRRRRSEAFIAEAASLSPGDYVVHVDHGIGRYDGLETLTVGGAAHDCLRLLYADNDKLFVPVENIEVLSRYGSEEAGAVLDRLGGAGWQTRRERVKRQLRDMAGELLKVAAARQLRSAPPHVPAEGVYDEFAARFPYPETEDQQRAIDDVLEDLGSGRPMDRLVCGDVGFGKTEVALRAAFVAVMDGSQVAIVVPTTLLARQHHRAFVERFKGIPVRIEQLSRLVTTKDSKAIRQGLADGSVDIVVGTHALLGSGIAFKNLGLLVVDEEQHFGVRQKEKLKQLRENVHVLTLTATPIPRTLQLALAGVRELSLIATPPVDRLAVRTFVLPYDPVVIREGILREHFRGGQVYYICPRIEDLPRVREQLAQLVPEVKVVTAHGRMAPTELEEIMSRFYDGQIDILLSTSIVESGLDVPRANTIIVHNADMFGLAQLYQLRGRIGRAKLRGYAYLTYTPRRVLSTAAQQRLHVIETLDTLGAGFSLASHDMDIRGAGNLLGEEQSGHIREVGVELYQQMLEDAVSAARRGGVADAGDGQWTPQINLGMPVLIPEDYVTDLHVRLDLYRRASRLADQAEIEAFAAELIDRFGQLPDEVENFLTLIALKRLCKEAGVERLDAGPRGAVVSFRNNSFARPDKLVEYIQRQNGAVKLRPDQKLVYARAWDSEATRVKGAQDLIHRLAALAA